MTIQTFLILLCVLLLFRVIAALTKLIDADSKFPIKREWTEGDIFFWALVRTGFILFIVFYYLT